MKARAAHARNIWGLTLRALYRLDVYGKAAITEPTLVCFTSAGPLTVPALRAAMPRPVHVLGVDIPFESPGISAAREGIAALERGQLVAGHPDDPVVAYLAARSGAALCPVVVIGAHGRIPSDPPRPGRRIAVHIGATRPGRHRASTASGVRAAREQLRQTMDDHGYQLQSLGSSP